MKLKEFIGLKRTFDGRVALELKIIDIKLDTGIKDYVYKGINMYASTATLFGNHYFTKESSAYIRSFKDIMCDNTIHNRYLNKSKVAFEKLHSSRPKTSEITCLSVNSADMIVDVLGEIDMSISDDISFIWNEVNKRLLCICYYSDLSVDNKQIIDDLILDCYERVI